MSAQEFRDAKGNLLGTVAPGDNGQLEGRDPRGQLKGTYDPRTDETRDAMGLVVAKGNVVSTLIFR